MLGARFAVTVSGTREQRVAAVARLQRGHVTRVQMRAVGLSDGMLDRLVRRGHLVRVHRGVFALAGLDPRAPLGAETAALLSVRDGALLGHRTAAALWGLVAAPNSPVHVVVEGGSAGRRRGVRIHRTVMLADSDRRLRQGLPLTSPARTLFDVAPQLSSRELELALDHGLVHRLLRPAELRARLGEAGDRRGRAAIRALLEAHGAPTITRSQAEEVFLALVRGAQLPAPLVNVHRHGYELDFLWEPQRLVVEIDGFTYHRTWHAFERDRRRDAALRAVGVATMRITWHQLQREPLAVIARLAAALAS